MTGGLGLHSSVDSWHRPFLIRYMFHPKYMQQSTTVYNVPSMYTSAISYCLSLRLFHSGFCNYIWVLGCCARQSRDDPYEDLVRQTFDKHKKTSSIRGSLAKPRNIRGKKSSNRVSGWKSPSRASKRRPIVHGKHVPDPSRGNDVADDGDELSGSSQVGQWANLSMRWLKSYCS